MKAATLRLIYLAIGWIALALGIIGAFLPVMPTVPFLIVALWGFSKSSERFHNWLYHHKVYGPMLRQWDRHRVIPLWGKVWACVAMAGSLAIMVFFLKVHPALAAVAAAVMLAVAVYILSKPSRPPHGS